MAPTWVVPGLLNVQPVISDVKILLQTTLLQTTVRSNLTERFVG